MSQLPISPLTIKMWRRFQAIRRGYYSLWILTILTLLALLAELWVNDRAVFVQYQGEWKFPVYGAVESGAVYGLEGEVALEPVDYRQLQTAFEGTDNLVILPLIPFSPNENSEHNGFFSAVAPSFESRHLLGTDNSGRDVFSRLVYGYRTAILFALAFSVLTFLIGGTLGALMGYLGGVFDLLFQRVIEVWSNIPFLYMVIIIFSIVPASLSIPVRITLLLIIMVLFSWTALTYYMRTETYREKSKDYVAAAVALGASMPRILFIHILPNTLATIVTFIPFTVISAISAVTALDFLGWGLPPPTPSLGELLKQGTASLTTAPWIAGSAFFVLVFVLMLVTFIGEAMREAFDPKKLVRYQ